MAGKADHRALQDLMVRALTAVVMVVVFGLAVWCGGIAWAGLIGAVSLIALLEWATLVTKMTRSLPLRAIGIALGVIYIGLAASALVALRLIDRDVGTDVGAYGLFNFRGGTVTLIGTVIAVDIGAYLAGRVIGGPRIAPSISPGKTWAGLGGGIVLAVLFMMTLHARDEYQFYYLAAAPVIAVIAQAGDFLESWMKRRAGVKDSGRWLPGHGGFLDRIDGLLAVAFLAGVARILIMTALL